MESDCEENRCFFSKENSLSGLSFIEKLKILVSVTKVLRRLEHKLSPAQIAGKPLSYVIGIYPEAIAAFLVVQKLKEASEDSFSEQVAIIGRDANRILTKIMDTVMSDRDTAEKCLAAAKNGSEIDLKLGMNIALIFSIVESDNPKWSDISDELEEEFFQRCAKSAEENESENGEG